MGKKQYPHEYVDAKGDTHREFANGSCEIYHGGFDDDRTYMEITDEADKMVKRRRFMPHPHSAAPAEAELLTRDEDAVPGIDLDEPELSDDIEEEYNEDGSGIEGDDPDDDVAGD